MKIHFSNYIYVACGKGHDEVKHSNIVEDVTCKACINTKIFKLFNQDNKSDE